MRIWYPKGSLPHHAQQEAKATDSGFYPSISTWIYCLAHLG